MNDTRESLGEKTPPRFAKGDMVAHPLRDYTLSIDIVGYDEEFSGNMVGLRGGLIMIHESNFVLWSERNDWEPHAENLWSYWTKKGKP